MNSTPDRKPLSPSDPNFLKGTLVLEACKDMNRFLSQLEALWVAPGAARQKIVVACAPGLRAWVLSALESRRFSPVEVVEARSLADLATTVPTRLFAYASEGAPVLPPDWEEPISDPETVKPWVPLVQALDGKGPRLGFPVFGWMADRALLEGPWGKKELPSLRDFETLARVERLNLSYVSSPALSVRPEVRESRPSPPRKAKVLALIPHFQCEEWLEGCLESLVGQTRPLDGILVLDDGSARPPRALVEKFKSATLWRAKENGGPYRLIQSAIEATGYDAYFFQDADDWSSRDRLERTIEEAERSGAEMVGTQELMYLKESVFPNHYPLEVARALAERPGYALLHPSSLVSRKLIFRAGGYATGLRFSGDMEFLLRACLVGKVVNLDRYCYFRRVRLNSLITSPQTGLSSPARLALDERVKRRFADNQARIAQGLAPRLEPLEWAGTVELEKICGPDLLPTP